MKVNKHLCSWIFDFLTDRPQYVRLKVNNNTFHSLNRVLNVGAPQGTCISPALYTIYTDSCRSTSNNVNFIKFADDTAIQGLLNKCTTNYFNEIDLFCKWCKYHSLHLNVSKTKEIIIDFRKKALEHQNVEIDGQIVEKVECYKYLGVTVNEKLNWTPHLQTIISKINQRMFFVRKLNSFNIDKTIISLFYQSVIQSLVSFCICIWGGNAIVKDIKNITSIIHQVNKITEIEHLSFDQILMKFSEKKMKKIINDNTHPLFNKISFSNRSNRLILIKTSTERYRQSFVPRTVKYLYDKNFRKSDPFKI